MNWIVFTKRTNDPKLSWLRKQLDEKGIPNRLNGESFHGPILEVDEDREAEAWAILTDGIDNKPDDHPMFRT